MALNKKVGNKTEGAGRRKSRKVQKVRKLSTNQRSTGNTGRKTKNTGDTGLIWGKQNLQTENKKRKTQAQDLINTWITGEDEKKVGKGQSKEQNMIPEERTAE